MFGLRPYTKNNNTISCTSPFADFDELERRFFDNAFFGSNALEPFRTDISDEGDAYHLEADLPGFDKKDITLNLSNDTLTIHAERHSDYESKEKNGKYLRCERSYGSYRRQFDVSGIDTEKIKAKYDNGVLHLTLPKKEQILPESKQLYIE